MSWKITAGASHGDRLGPATRDGMNYAHGAMPSLCCRCQSVASTCAHAPLTNGDLLSAFLEEEEPQFALQYPPLPPGTGSFSLLLTVNTVTQVRDRKYDPKSWSKLMTGWN